VLYFLTSERLGFRCWSEDDLPLALALWGDSQVSRLITGPFTPEMIRARLTAEIEFTNQHGIQYWPIFLLKDGRFVGCTGLRPYHPEQKIYELGYHLRPEFWGQGLATEAAHAATRYAFEKLHASALFAGHHPDNAASRHILTKLGFVYTHDEPYGPTGEMHASYLLRKDQFLI
jgi:[ribosomal protein S5]-alanine N-acetyltransferase